MAQPIGRISANLQAYFLPPIRRQNTADSLPMSASIHLARVAERLRAFMELRGIKKAEVVKFLGITTSKFSNWTSGRNYPDEYLMTLFCSRYGMTMEYLYRGVTLGLPGDVVDDLARAEAGISVMPLAQPARAPAVEKKS